MVSSAPQKWWSSVIPYRRRERWAWFTLWFYPAFWVVHLVGRLSVRATVDHVWLPYDRARFFENLSLTPIDFKSQLGAAAQLTTWSVGPELRLWRTPSLRLYSFSALGRGSRRSRGRTE